MANGRAQRSKGDERKPPKLLAGNVANCSKRVQFMRNVSVNTRKNKTGTETRKPSMYERPSHSA